MKLSYSRLGFTLVELLVSLAVLVVVSLMLVQITNSTGATWRHTNAKIEQFRSAGDAFEAMARRISQATLNTYWDYDNSNNPKRYVRKSELRFLCGQSEEILGSGSRPTHCIFFNAPLGYVEDRGDFAGLDNLLNTWGYYIEFNKEDRPDFLDSIPNPPKDRYRYRLMEMMEPSEKLSLYDYTSGTDNGRPTGKVNASSYDGKDWVTDALDSINASTGKPPVHALAENVIAMVILPKRSKKEEQMGKSELAPLYEYDSSPQSSSGKQNESENQLPPILQITLVAIDEASASRIAKDDTPPSFDSTLQSLFQSASSYESDLKTLESALRDAHINYRIFTTNVSIRGAKWSS